MGCTPGRVPGPPLIFRKMIYYGKTKKSTHGHRTTLPFCTHFTLATQSAQSYRNPAAYLPCTTSPTSLARVLHRRPRRPSLTVLPYTYPTPPSQPSYPILPALLHVWLPYTRSRSYPTPTLYHLPMQCLSTVPATKSDRPTLHLCCPLRGGLPYRHHSLAWSQDGPSQRPSPASLPYTQSVAGRFPPGGGTAIPHGQVPTGYPAPVRDTPYAAPSRGAYIGEI